MPIPNHHASASQLVPHQLHRLWALPRSSSSDRCWSPSHFPPITGHSTLVAIRPWCGLGCTGPLCRLPSMVLDTGLELLRLRALGSVLLRRWRRDLVGSSMPAVPSSSLHHSHTCLHHSGTHLLQSGFSPLRSLMPPAPGSSLDHSGSPPPPVWLVAPLL
jgi:hypothetical protein